MSANLELSGMTPSQKLCLLEFAVGSLQLSRVAALKELGWMDAEKIMRDRMEEDLALAKGRALTTINGGI